MKRNRLFTVLTLGVLAAFIVTGCGQRAGDEEKQKPTEAQTQAETRKQEETEAPVEEIVISQTEAPTEAVTEVQTEAVTEPAPEPETEAEVFVPTELSVEEEEEQESELDQIKTYYAKDDINVRSTPDTENSDNVISSYIQGEKVSVVGETPNWYVVSKDDWTGYVYKSFLSETVVEEKSEQERSDAADEEAVRQAEAQAEISADAEQAMDYSESFAITLTSDANLRSDASSQANIIGILNEGDVVTALGESDHWFRVDVDGTIGYISRDLAE